jgi:perosamine synthetase
MQTPIPWSRPNLWGRECEYIQDALDSMWLSGGPYIHKLEQRFASLLGRECLAVSNGTTAIHLVYLGIGLGPGDQVIVPGFGFLAAANIALHMGLVPRFAEVDPHTWCLDPHDAARKMTSATRAVVAVHTYGNLCDMDAVRHYAEERGVVVIEDCAESLFSKQHGRYCGTLGQASTFSFQATKTLTTGEGGMVATDNAEWLERMKLYHSHGLRIRGTYNHELPGHNFRMTNLQAAMGVAQAECMETIIAERKRVFDRYRRCLGEIDGVHLQQVTPGTESVWWALAVRLEARAFPQGRDTVIVQLKEAGIETRPGFIASSLLRLYESHRLPICEALSEGIISLPSFATLTDDEISFICSRLRGLRK